MKKIFKQIFILSFSLILILSAYNSYAAKALVNKGAVDTTIVPDASGFQSPVYDPGGSWDAGGTGSALRNGNTGGTGGGQTNNGTTFSCNSLSGQNGKVVFSDILNFVGCTISTRIIPLLLAIAVMVFLYGVVTYIASADDEEKRKVGRQYVMYGIIGLFVIVSVWGLVNILSNTFGINNAIPQLNVQPQ